MTMKRVPDSACITQLSGGIHEGNALFAELMFSMAKVTKDMAITAMTVEEFNPIQLANGDGFYLHIWEGRLCTGVWNETHSSIDDVMVDMDDKPQLTHYFALKYLKSPVVLFPNGDWSTFEDLRDTAFRVTDCAVYYPQGWKE